ncbi:hypothetical protein BT93_L2975 [Corymbia citriodora subsp. variegata]|uniref:HMA domain-containing protein n=1 Tax=Corymbia citriodora subsp. variegata TaxID=360336 RepID=A0A8T0CN09_CORYI|nr:hypothetical protein BT93_L2975 [Corymbia citriodora subsp. variegata]
MKKAVIKVCMNDDTSRFCCFNLRSSCSKALRVASGFQGVQSVKFLGDDKDRIEVIGGLDPVGLTTLLRKKVGFAQILTVSEAEADKKESKSKDKPDESKKPKPVECPCPCPRPCPRPEIVIIGDRYPEPGCWFM